MSLPTESLVLFSGLPGAGKSLFAVDLAVKYAKEGTRVFSWGLDGASPDLFEVLPEDWQFSDWQSLPEGSVVFFDEAHKLLPTRTRDAPPKPIQDLTEIRHFGLRFVFMTQDPRNLDVFVRRLIGRHFHLTRKMGFSAAHVKSWDRCIDDPTDFHAGKTAITSLFTYPKKHFSLYKSSSMHLVKKKVPLKVLLSALAVVAGLAFVSYVGFTYYGKASSGDLVPGGDSPAVSSAVADAVPEYTTLKEYMTATTPLSPVLPWTAPIYVYARKVERTPGKLVCYIGSRGCKCFTDQMTRQHLPEPVCEAMVRDGVYDPYSPAYADLGEGEGVGASLGATTPSPSSSPVYSAIDGQAVPTGSGAFAGKITDPENGG